MNQIRPSTRILMALSFVSAIAVTTFDTPWPTVALLVLFALAMSTASTNAHPSE